MSQHELCGELDLVTDGKKLMLCLGDQTLILDSFFVTSANVEIETQPIGYCSPDKDFSVVGPKSVRISIELMGGKVDVTDEKQLDYKFAMDMTVRELLQAVNKKLKKRKGKRDGKEKAG